MVVPYPLGIQGKGEREWSSDSRLTHRSHSTRSRIAQYTCNRQPSRTVTFGENTPTRRIASVRKRDARRDRARRAERTSRQQQQQQQRGGREKMWVYRLLNFYFSAKNAGRGGNVWWWWRWRVFVGMSDEFVTLRWLHLFDWNLLILNVLLTIWSLLFAARVRSPGWEAVDGRKCII